jgi:cob(I)alamin adenosyltransferase
MQKKMNRITNHELRIKNKGMVYVFTGDGKGKTSAAIGVGVRAALSGMKVGMVCWYKKKNLGVSEWGLPKVLKNFAVYPMGEGFRLKIYDLRFENQKGKHVKIIRTKAGRVVDKASLIEHKKAARGALEKARKLIGKVDVLILDEVNNAVFDKLISLIDLINLISKRGKTHLILTGRDACAELVEAADLVTEMKKIKHPFDKGIKAVRGLDY